MLDEAKEIMRTKDNAQSSLVIKKVLKKRKKRVKEHKAIEKRTKHFSEQFYCERCQSISAGQPTSVESSEVAKAVVKLESGKLLGRMILRPKN